MIYIGIDLGTSAVKILAMDEKGTVYASVSETYSISFPKTGWAEQKPEDWYHAVIRGIHRILEKVDSANIRGISFSGQMHGLVVLDEMDEVIRPAILWNDSRAVKETAYLNQVVGKKKIASYTGNIAFPGFTAPKLLWMKEKEPEKFSKICKIMLPKDYLVYKLSGTFCTDYSDASGTLLLDVRKRCWSEEMLHICEVKYNQLPQLRESDEEAGELKRDLSETLGIRQNVKIIVGAADNPAAAVGTGAVGEGMCNISLGTSGTVFMTSKQFRMDADNALHAFAHADGGYYLMGCMLSAASCNKWWVNDILGQETFETSQRKITELGENKVFYLPYLMGERSPHNDPYARGVFVGMSMNTTQEEMTQSVMEGVVYALRDCLEVAKKSGILVEKATLCGGGAKSFLWKRMVANILNLKVEIPQQEEGPAYGAAILAATGCGEFANLCEAAEHLCKVKEKIFPERELVQKYEQKYKKFQKIYPALKGVFREIAE